MLTSQSLALNAAVARMESPADKIKIQISEQFGFKYHQITKCGCTFTKTLINQLDGRSSTAHPIKIDWSSGGPPAFVIIRNPIDRFISLYFDKILRGSSGIGRKFLNRHLVDRDAASLMAHQLNCLQSLGWINSTITGRSSEPTNYHWRPQVRRLHKISKMDVHVLTLDGLSWQLPYLLRGCCPNISDVMKRVGMRNVSPKPCDASQLASQKLRKQISRIYADDERVYSEANRHWAKIGTRLGHHGQDIKQTARGWLVTDRQACWNNIQRGGQ